MQTPGVDKVSDPEKSDITRVSVEEVFGLQGFYDLFDDPIFGTVEITPIVHLNQIKIAAYGRELDCYLDDGFAVEPSKKGLYLLSGPSRFPGSTAEAQYRRIVATSRLGQGSLKVMKEFPLPLEPGLIAKSFNPYDPLEKQVEEWREASRRKVNRQSVIMLLRADQSEKRIKGIYYSARAPELGTAKLTQFLQEENCIRPLSGAFDYTRRVSK